MPRRLSRVLCVACAAALFGAAPAHSENERYREETGRLEDGGRQLSSGEYFHEFSVSAEAGNVVIVELHSDDFDAFLQMMPRDKTGPNGERIWHNNDMRRGSHDACLAVELPEEGDYDILVTSAGPNQQGTYQFAMTLLPGPARTETDRLAEEDRQLESGEFCDYYEFDAEAGDVWIIDVTSADFNTYVFGRSFDNAEFRIDNDDAFNDPQHSQVAMLIPRNGKYYVGVTSAKPGETGDYRLTFSFTKSIGPTAGAAEPGLIRQGAMGIGLAPRTTAISAPAHDPQ